MSATLTTDIVALLAACRAQPDDDTRRLVLADALDDLDTVSVPCPTCSPYADDPCPHCGSQQHVTYFKGPGATNPNWKDCQTCNGGKAGTNPGSVTDTSNRDRAKLIRVQVELAADPKSKYGCRKCTSPAVVNPAFTEDECCCRYKSFYASEFALLALHPDWLPPCPTCHARRTQANADRAGMPATCATCNNTGRVGHFARGLLVVPVPTLSTVFEQFNGWIPCFRCKAKKEILDTDNYGRTVGLRDCPACQGKGGKHETIWQLTPWARTLREQYSFAAEVPVADRVPGIWHVRSMYGWNIGALNSPCWVPEFVFDCLAGWDHIGDGFKLWKTEEAANRALAVAVARAIYDGGMP